MGQLGEAAAKLAGGAAVAPAGSRQMFPGAGHGLADGMEEGCHNQAWMMMASRESLEKMARQVGGSAVSSGQLQKA